MIHRARADEPERRTSQLDAQLSVTPSADRSKQRSEYEEHDDRRQVEHAGPREHAADRGEDRFARLVDEGGKRAAPARVEPGEEHPDEDHELQSDQDEPDEV